MQQGSALLRITHNLLTLAPVLRFGLQEKDRKRSKKEKRDKDKDKAKAVRGSGASTPAAASSRRCLGSPFALADTELLLLSSSNPR